jgi:hypothetical protein
MAFEDDDSINGEIRYITIELMKIAAQRNITFEQAAREFLKNAIFLKRLIEITESTDQISRVLSSQIPLQQFQPPIEKQEEKKNTDYLEDKKKRKKKE